jgi:SAM-dependent methyltransferase
MRSQELDLTRYNTDKIANGYLKWYDPIFADLIDSPLKMLEVGIFKGGSLHLWRDYFPRADVTGIDLNTPESFEPGERVRLFQGSQSDTSFLSRVSTEVAPEGFDLIIEDASHVGVLSKVTFWHLFDHHLKPGGLYVIEDWGTGYWGDWPDGAEFRPKSFGEKVLGRLWPPMKRPWHCHSHGMVGFVKELVDEQGAADLTRRNLIGKPQRQSKFESLSVTPSIVFVRKLVS